ncbi:MAG: ATP-dependent helicase C-terminal domain-containing protein [Phycisphaerales bacterium]
MERRRRATGRVERRVLRLPHGGVDDLELSRTEHVGARASDRASAAEEIVERIMRGELRLARWDEGVEQWIARVLLLARLFPERRMIAYDDDDRRVILHEIVGRASRFGEVQEKPCLEAVQGALSWEDRQFVQKHAPETLGLPSGKRLRIEYGAEGPPIGRARIQDLYDLAETPRIAAGRQVVLLEILGPNQRPVQRTTDLAGFWRTLYPELRKELRRRYPRHEWR